MSHVITISTQKGGVGKTTTAHALAYGLHRLGFKVLALDLDPQTNLTFTFCGNQEQPGIFQALTNPKIEIKDLIQETAGGVRYIPGALNLGELEANPKRIKRDVKAVIQETAGAFDFIIIDTPPNLGRLTFLALEAATVFVIPSQLQIFSIQAALDTAKDIKSLGKNGKSFVLMTGTKARPTKAEKETAGAFETLAKQNGLNILNTKIRETPAIKALFLNDRDIYTAAPKAAATLDYMELTKELIKATAPELKRKGAAKKTTKRKNKNA